MKLIVGLGNPGNEYKNTRHNIGFIFLEWWQKEQKLAPWKIENKFKGEISRNGSYIFLKPQTFMNLSGNAVAAVVKFYEIDVRNDLIVAFDDLDLEVGNWKTQQGKGPHGHNGLESIYKALGLKDWMHVRIGIDGRAGARTCPPQNYVLQNFPPFELKLIQNNFQEIKNRLEAGF